MVSTTLFRRLGMGGDHVSFLKDKGFWNPQNIFFMDDSVHFNDLINFIIFEVAGVLFCGPYICCRSTDDKGV